MGDITSLLAKLDYGQAMLKLPATNILTYQECVAIWEANRG